MSTKHHRRLQPAPPRPRQPPAFPENGTSFYDLPPELRIEIYNLVLSNVTLHILPPTTTSRRRHPHALLRTSHQIRNEVLPLVHSSCPIRAEVTDFNFDGLLTWLARIPPLEQKYLVKNSSLRVSLCTTLQPPGELGTLRRWLHDRADPCREQPNWTYSGPTPSSKVANDLRRRIRRMKEPRKQAELKKMVKAIGVAL